MWSWRITWGLKAVLGVIPQRQLPCRHPGSPCSGFRAGTYLLKVISG